jgi:cellulose synthase/poly-beta-1,6-N-acetylglucosamine synthase-like glycosyltransferase
MPAGKGRGAIDSEAEARLPAGARFPRARPKRAAVPPPSLLCDDETNIQSRVLRRLGLRDAAIEKAAADAGAHGTSVYQELLAARAFEADALRDALSAELGIAAIRVIDPDRLVLRDMAGLGLLRNGAHMGAHYRPSEGASVYLVCAETADGEALAGALARQPDLADRLRLVTSAGLRAAIVSAMEDALSTRARDHLFLARPSASARYVANAWQGLALGAMAVAVPLWFWLDWQTANFAIHLALSVFFLACVVLRFLAVLTTKPLRLPRIRRPKDQPPVYTVLVALYREAPVVPQLMKALDELEWPRSRLEVKLVCEADDLETIGAIERLKPAPWIEIVRVPPGSPRTKPKALAYALPLCSGTLIALFDAEDRPHPDQLVEAWSTFRADPTGTLACLQAPIVVTNDRASAISRLLAFEYAALFRALLPWLGKRGLLVPLGGTSNHFRRDALDEVGGWDPYNVTEDADLGARLTRHGYRVSTITRPTFEDGPETLGVWLPQRTRWFKGWMQSWLVHMRRPQSLLREIGLPSFLILQILFLGMVVSALAHPFFIGSLVWLLFQLGWHGRLDAYNLGLMGLDIVNILGGYIAFLLIGWRTLSLRENVGFPKVVLFTPVYWVLLSFAAWRALWQLYRRPHHWEKTPHAPTLAPSRLQTRLTRRAPVRTGRPAAVSRR